MANKLKTYAILTLVVLGLVFLGIGCTGNENSRKCLCNKLLQMETPTERSCCRRWNSRAQSITLKGSDTVLPLAQAEAEEFMTANTRKKCNRHWRRIRCWNYSSH